MLTAADVAAAAERIEPHVERTPVLTSASLDADCGASLFFKCENFQKIGAFKARGAMNAVLLLDDDAAARGVATHSSGNHGAALARAAAIRGIACTVVVPRGANKAKLANMRRHGAKLVECEPTQRGRESTLADVVAGSGATVVHPYADDAVMAGQGTVAMELFAQVDALDLLIVPLGGGGLIAGCATWVAEHFPGTRVIGVEPDGAADCVASIEAGRVVPVEPDTIADGLRATVGAPNLAIIRERVERVVTVSDAEIASAMRDIMERMKIVVEPSCAVGLAAIQAGSIDVQGLRAGIVLTGGNADLTDLFAS
ncbi:MAG: threonine/serine dehydratase [Gammaproteobacteria bacterium]|nr:threonine/serine dehydratase [Gammaproteobacteria bacterium]